ncbi:MAG: hypothetical protein ACM3N7_10520 [Planctomycetaceae bacterium]
MGGKQILFAFATLGMLAQAVTLHPIYSTAMRANDFYVFRHFNPFHPKPSKEPRAGSSRIRNLPLADCLDAPESFPFLFYQFFMLQEKPKNKYSLTFQASNLMINMNTWGKDIRRVGIPGISDTPPKIEKH